MTATQPAETAVGQPFSAFVEHFGPRWADAWNSQEPDRVLALMTEDIEYDDSAWPRTMHGHADVREFLEHTWRAFPDLRFELAHQPFLAPEARQACYHWRGYATHAGPIDPPGVAATGREVQFEGFDLHEYRDGQVARLLIVFDLSDISRQLGLMPARGSRTEHAMVALQRLAKRVSR
jgi:steroid delta-isomerase-like uncharacterized protein